TADAQQFPGAQFAFEAPNGPSNLDAERAFQQAIESEHSYCRPRIQVKEAPATAPLPSQKPQVGRPKKEKENKENQEKRKRKKKEVTVDETVQPNVFAAVASEWRKAKRKNVTSEIDHYLVAENDENKFVEPKAEEP